MMRHRFIGNRSARQRVAAVIAACAVATLLVGCAVGPNYRRPDVGAPAHWSGAALRPADPAVPAAPLDPTQGRASPAISALSERPGELASWWTAFHDPKLDALIERALQGSLDLRVAVQRSREALAQRDVSAAPLWPTLTANAAYDRQRISESVPQGAIIGEVGKASIPGIGRVSIPNPYNQLQLGAAAAWEPDLFGRLRRSVEAADASARVSLEDQRAVRVSLLAQVAAGYLQLRGAQERRAVTLESLATLGELLDLTRQRQSMGVATELDVRNAAAELSQLRSTLPAVEEQISRSVHQLSLLLGGAPETLRAELDQPGVSPPLPPEVPIGLPAELARRRPDIRAAEASLHAATAQIGVAIGALFPRLTLTASGGFQAETPGGLLRWKSLFGSVGPELEIPVFDRGRWMSVRLYRLKAQEAALSYRSAVLNALREVEDAASAYRADQQQRQWLTDAVAQNQVAVALARQRYQSGVSDFLHVLDAQRGLQQDELALLASTTAAGGDLVELYRALGGGWDAGKAPAPTASAAPSP